MKIKSAKALHICILIVAVFALAAMGFMSCGERSSLSWITISPADYGMAIGTSRQFTATGMLTNGVTYLESYMTWTSSNPGLASVDSTGVVTAGSATGGTTITATETDSHTNVSGSTTVTVDTVSALALTPLNPSMAINATHQFMAVATLSTKATWTQDVSSYMTWTTTDSTIATVDSTGLVTAVSAGTTTIQATENDSIIATGQSALTVAPLMLTVTTYSLFSIAVTADNTSVAVDATQQLTATGTYEDYTTAIITSAMTWSSGDTSIATVDPTTGLVTGVTGGYTVTITATDPITTIYGSIDITVY